MHGFGFGDAGAVSVAPGAAPLIRFLRTGIGASTLDAKQTQHEDCPEAAQRMRQSRVTFLKMWDHGRLKKVGVPGTLILDPPHCGIGRLFPWPTSQAQYQDSTKQAQRV